MNHFWLNLATATIYYLMKGFAIDNSLDNPTYTLAKKEILDSLRFELCSFGISTTHEDLDPPSFNRIHKLQKSHTGSAKCSMESLSKLLTLILSVTNYLWVVATVLKHRPQVVVTAPRYRSWVVVTALKHQHWVVFNVLKHRPWVVVTVLKHRPWVVFIAPRHRCWVVFSVLKHRPWVVVTALKHRY